MNATTVLDIGEQSGVQQHQIGEPTDLRWRPRSEITVIRHGRGFVFLAVDVETVQVP